MLLTSTKVSGKGTRGCSSSRTYISFYRVSKTSEKNMTFLKKYDYFHCRLWIFGEWQMVVIDDLLPTRHGHLIFAQSPNPQVFWVALVEKTMRILMAGGSTRLM